MHPLDNHVWHALTTSHERFAIGGDLARRYPEDVTPFAGLAELTPAALKELASVTPVGVGLGIRDFDDSHVNKDWEIVDKVIFTLMVCDRHDQLYDQDARIMQLAEADLPNMFRLIEIARPGPLLPRALELGSFYGIKENGQLVSMTGIRVCLTGYQEITSVSTHPDYRGRGYAARIVSHMVRKISQDGNIPFLGVVEGNNAKRLYEHLGFKTYKSQLRGTFIRRRGSSQ